MLKIIKKRVALILAVSLIISSFQISVKAATSDVIDYGYDKHLVNIQIKDETGASYLGTEYEVYDSNNNKLLSVTNSNNPCIFSSDLKAVTDLSKGMYPTNFESLLGKKIQGIHYIGATTTTSSGTSNYTLCYGQSPAKELKNVDLSLQYGLEYTLKINYYEYMPTAITLQENTVAVLNNSPNSYQAYVRLNNDEKIYPEYDGTNTPSYYEYEPGNYKLYTGVQNGGGAVGPPKVVVSDEKKEYFKVKIHLATVFPDYFTDEGLMKIKDSYKQEVGKDELPRGLNYLSEDKKKTMNCEFFILSGSFIQMPNIDENGDVEIYVLKDTYSFTLYDAYGYKYYDNTSGGGGSYKTGYIDSKYTEMKCKTSPIINKGVSVKESRGKP